MTELNLSDEQFKKLLHVAAFNDLRGLDYFTQEQAARYMCRSLSKFKETSKTYRIPSVFLDGIKMFRKTDLQKVIENERTKQWQQSAPGVRPGTSVTRKTAKNVVDLSGRSLSVKPNE